ncbi:hypothetical protein QTP88_017258 [Uroleucon formosanum]
MSYEIQLELALKINSKRFEDDALLLITGRIDLFDSPVIDVDVVILWRILPLESRQPNTASTPAAEAAAAACYIDRPPSEEVETIIILHTTNVV